jgi:hypothetical protein
MGETWVRLMVQPIGSRNKHAVVTAVTAYGHDVLSWDGTAITQAFLSLGVPKLFLRSLGSCALDRYSRGGLVMIVRYAALRKPHNTRMK